MTIHVYIPTTATASVLIYAVGWTRATYCD